LGDEADTWRHVLPQIGEPHRVLAPDLPGFGRSDKGKRSYSIPFFVETLRELLDHLPVSRVTLAGHSTGAVIAHAFALAHPERVEGLVLIGGSLVSQENRINTSLLLFLIPGVGEMLYNRLRKDPQAAYGTLAPYYHRLEDLPQADRDFLFQRVNERVWSDGQRRGFFSTLRNLVSWLPAQQKTLPERLRGWRIPTSVVWGAEDQISPAGNARALQQLVPSARLVIVPEAGHNVHQEKADVVVEAILQAAGANTEQHSIGKH
jgi:pimeloyl-ACP methyl ester carboxylesterase